jgi:selenide,water dikinase
VAAAVPAAAALPAAGELFRNWQRVKRLLLAGGGHSHVEVVRRFGLEPPGGAEIVLASPARYTAYSGMLPGLIAGHYGFHDCHIDLETLCNSSAVTFKQAEVSGLDLARNCALLKQGGELPFDWLSLDVGSTPDAAGAAGGSRNALPVKPVSTLLAGLESILAAARQGTQHIAIVGGGAGGVELALAVHHRLQDLHGAATRVTLVTDAPVILPSHPAAARRIFERLFAERGIRLQCGSRASTMEAGTLYLGNGERLAVDWILWATSASAPAWLSASGLATDARGFVLVNDTLQSISHANVFATGDCASLNSRPLPKSGVHAVRQGPPLAANLRNALAGMPPVPYSPQRFTLSLISTGDRRAVASWGPVVFEGGWVWRWKDRIDRRFVARYRGVA